MSPFVFGSIDDLCVCEFSSLYSDAHSPVSLTFKNAYINVNTNNITPINNNGKRIPLNADKSDMFVENFDIIRVSEIETKLNKILDQHTTTKTDIDDIVMNIGSLFQSCSNETFGAPKPEVKKVKR